MFIRKIQICNGSPTSKCIKLFSATLDEGYERDFLDIFLRFWKFGRSDLRLSFVLVELKDVKIGGCFLVLGMRPSESSLFLSFFSDTMLEDIWSRFIMPNIIVVLLLCTFHCDQLPSYLIDLYYG